MRENKPASPELDPVGVHHIQGRQGPPRRLIRFWTEPPRPSWKQATKRTRREQIDHRRRQQPLIAAELRRRGCSPERAEAVAHCRMRLVLVDPSSPEQARWTTSSCNHRACPSCTERRNLQRLKRSEGIVRREVQRGSRLVFATLTSRRVPGIAIADARRKHRRALSTISRQKFYREGVSGTLVKSEGHGTPDDGPHEHLHVVLLITSDEVPAKLRKAWQRAIGDPEAVVWIQCVPVAEAGHVLAYMSKPDDASPAEIVDRAIALRGTHDLTSTGVLKRRSQARARGRRSRSSALAVDVEVLRRLAAGGQAWASDALATAERRLR